MLIKKEQMYDELFEENNNIINENEIIFNNLKESEDIRNEQNKLIISLQKEVQKLRENFYEKFTINEN